jgi:hypothetical protein
MAIESTSSLPFNSLLCSDRNSGKATRRRLVVLTGLLLLSTTSASAAASIFDDPVLAASVLAPGACPCWDMQSLINVQLEVDRDNAKDNSSASDGGSAVVFSHCGATPVSTHDPTHGILNRTKWEFTTTAFPLGSACSGFGCYLDTPVDACVFLPGPSTWPDGYKAAKLVTAKQQYACAFLLAAACGMSAEQHYQKQQQQLVQQQRKDAHKNRIPSEPYVSPTTDEKQWYSLLPNPVDFGLDPHTMQEIRATGAATAAAAASVSGAADEAITM